MSLVHQSLFHVLLLSVCSLCILAAPTLSGAPQTIIELPSVLPTTPNVETTTATSSAPPASSLSSPPPTSSAPSADVFVFELAGGSPSWIATTEIILRIPQSSDTALGVSASPISTSDTQDSAALSANTAAQSSNSVMPTSLLVADPMDAPTTSAATRTTLYVPPTSTDSAAVLQDAVTSASTGLPPVLSLSKTSSAASSIPVSSTHTSSYVTGSASMDDPNPTAETRTTSNAASQTSRRSAILAAFLTIGTLAMLGITMVCMRCKLPCRGRRVKGNGKKVRFADPDEEQAQQVPSMYGEKDEKTSVIPGPPTPTEIILPSLPQQPSSSTPNLQPDWRVYAPSVEGQFEDVTHILSTSAFAPIEAEGGSPGADSVLSGASEDSSRAASSGRASGGAVSLTAESYKSCESRYSSPSLERQSRDGPPDSGSSDSMHLSPTFHHSPSPPASELIQTPDPGMGVAFVPLEHVGGKEAHKLVRGRPESDEVDEVGSEWDVAKAYGAHSSVGQESVLSVVVENMESVEVGGRKCVLVQG
ncbi:uncharacterized protein LAESUDRAFT_726238 [Laetiporus sulphureus 93-53]|uniref:Uncharacterized protein n=1 Tax=Laetiporus sulphureus 93-53 TaxID=1314785 RepID=A0A165E0Y8_9APHY|nr:uncharacterized protein LAESUDRAFT_726238 [Laetiporus sulphureus 93-53]KZT06036.1 hypothetical protein LAESUDRAFT_726238 [Laetiporus sulphureus 93-53]